MGGAIVFPGGKVEPADVMDAWVHLAQFPPEMPGAWWDAHGHTRGAFVAACRETLEEACILHAIPPIDGERAAALRIASERDGFAEALRAGGLRIDASALRPFGRWITPAAESRRFDTRFFLARCPEDQDGAHDLKETVRSFWATPAEILRRFEAGDAQLFPPTHRTLENLSCCESVDAAFAVADASCLDPVCPLLVPHVDDAGGTMALVLPGDPEHEIASRRVAGRSRYVLRGTMWRSEDAPSGVAQRPSL